MNGAAAYLVGFVDTTQSPPTIHTIGIFSASALEITCRDRIKAWPIDLFYIQGSYSEAYDEIVRLIREDAAYAWLRPLLAERTHLG